MRVNVKIPEDDPEFHRRLKAAAALAGETIGEFVRKAVNDRIQNEQGVKK